MAKILRKLLLIPLIFLLVTSWIFSGWPRIWQKPPFPPKIQEAQAATVTKTYSFPSNSEGWTNTSCGQAPGATCAWQSGDGSPAAGSLEEDETRKGKSGTWTWQLSSITWESLGVPANSTVTAVDGSYNHKMVTCTSCGTTNTSGNLLIRDSGDTATIATLETAVTYSGATSWASRNASGAQSIGASYQASNTGIILRITGTLATENVTGARATLRQDEISLIITYTTLSITAPANVQMPNYTLGGAGYSERNFSDVSGLVQVTAGAGFTVTVVSTNLTGTNNTILASNVKLKTDGTASSNPTQIINCSGFSGITEASSGEYSLNTTQTIVTTSSGSGTCDIYPTIRVYISNNLRAEQDTGTLTFTVQ